MHRQHHAKFVDVLVHVPPPRFGRLWFSLAPVRRHWHAFMVMNVLFFGVYLIAMATVALRPSMQTETVARVERELQSSWLAPAVAAYRSGNLPVAILMTFSINFLVGCIVTINVPSLLIPFAGVAKGLFRAALWGVMFSPVEPASRMALLPHYLNTLVEGECYVLAMLAAYLQGRWVLPTDRPRGELYGEGLVETFRIYRLIVPLLAFAAIYEAIEVIYVVPLLK